MGIYSAMPRDSKALQDLSPDSLSQLSKLGQNLRDAITVRETLQEFADRTQMNRQTLRKVLSGNASVPIGFYIAALEALGLTDHLDGIAAPERDDIGQALRLGRLTDKKTDLPRDF